MFPMEDREYCGEAVHLKGAQHCRVTNNRFAAVGGNAVYLEDYNLKNVIQATEIDCAGHCGVVLLGQRDDPNGLHLPMCNDVVDNTIHHCGVFDKVAVGVFCGVSSGNVIGHNLIEHVPHHAINLGNSGYGRNIVEYNRIRHSCQETGDNAAINCWMEDEHVERDAVRSGHVFRYNFVSDTPGACTFGIYLDNHSSNCLVYGNIIVRTGLSGIRVNGGRNNLIENNIVVGNGEWISFWTPANALWPQMKGFMSANQFCRNVVYRPGSGTKPLINIDDLPEYGPQVIGESDDNLFFDATGREFDVTLPGGKVIPFAEWRKMGYDEHSLIADPRFVDPEHDDYRLKPESPAFGLGFQPIDVRRIGPRAKSVR
jgi:parallel beta-helix repeat protein